MSNYVYSLGVRGGGQGRQDDDLAQQQRRNALAMLEQQQARGRQFDNALMNGGVDAAAQVDPQAAAPFLKQRDEQNQRALEGIATRAWGVYTAPSPRVAAQSMGSLESFAEELGKPVDQVTDDEVRALARVDAYQAISQAGLDPAKFKEPEAPQQPYAVQQQRGPGGATIYSDGKRFQVVAPNAAPAPPREPPETFSPFTQADGTTVLLGNRGTIRPTDLRGPIKQSPANDKARQAAAVKIPQVDAAVRRVERLAQASENLGGMLADGGPVDGFALSRTPSGQELTQAGANLIQVLTALTRTPGIGSQSDLEQRLAMLQLPTPDMYPAVRQRAVAELRQFMSELRQAYVNVAAGQGVAMPDEAGGAGIASRGPAAPAGVVDFGSLK